MKCSCDDLEIITYVDDNTGERLISHGVCRKCLRNVCPPPITLAEYYRALSYVSTHPPEMLYMYHTQILWEMIRREFTPDYKWFFPEYRRKAMPSTPGGPLSLPKSCPPVHIYPEHDEAYLNECLNNLLAKGIDLRNMP